MNQPINTATIGRSQIYHRRHIKYDRGHLGADLPHIKLYDDIVGTWKCVIVRIIVAVLAVTRASGAYTEAWMSWVQPY